jgi:hypothetical protein
MLVGAPGCALFYLLTVLEGVTCVRRPMEVSTSALRSLTLTSI